MKQNYLYHLLYQFVTVGILRLVKLKVFFLQFGNTCYCNSVLQALYFCQPFREKVLAYKPQNKRKETLLTCLSDLFGNIASQKKKVGVMAPKKFVARLRKENGKGNNYVNKLQYVASVGSGYQHQNRAQKFYSLPRR